MGNDKMAPVLGIAQVATAVERAVDLRDAAVPLLPEGIRVEDRRATPEMVGRPALLLVAVCPACEKPFIFITSERDTCNYATECSRCANGYW